METSFWSERSVLVTGHTGFKGSWLCLLLRQLGARVSGFALEPPGQPNMFEAAHVGNEVRSVIGDVRELGAVDRALVGADPDVVFHLAAQPIVRRSYADPVQTYATNVMGTVNVLDSVRRHQGVRVLVVVTSDKCYENREWLWGYRENEPLGGQDPYSSSKACAEMVTSAFRDSYFRIDDSGSRVAAIGTVRAGNVIGGGDWAEDRIIPDAVRAFAGGEILTVRAPHAIRPWQHVLEPLSGYLALARHLWDDPVQHVGSWNFGPSEEDLRPVNWIVERMAKLWGGSPRWELRPVRLPHEARYLRLDCTKARTFLGWSPRLCLATTLEWLVEWYQAYYQGLDVRKLSSLQIERYRTLSEA